MHSYRSFILLKFVSMENITRNCDPMVDLKKFISIKKILNGVIALVTTKFDIKFSQKFNYIGSKKI